MSTRLAQMLWGSSPPPAPSPLGAAGGLPARAGIELEPEHCRAVLETRPAFGFFEVCAEACMADAGRFHGDLDRVRQSYPLALHSAGLSIGAQGPLDEGRLNGLAELIARYQPASLSERLARHTQAGRCANEPSSLAYDAQTLERACQHIDLVQNRVQRRMLLENPSIHAESAASTMSPSGFLRELVARTGCGLALDMASARVCENDGRDFVTFVDDLPLDAVGEIRLAGFADEAMWALYARVIVRMGPTPTLLERGSSLASLPALLMKARHAENTMSKRVTPHTCGIYWGCA